jgi:hypothetical protein
MADQVNAGNARDALELEIQNIQHHRLEIAEEDYELQRRLIAVQDQLQEVVFEERDDWLPRRGRGLRGRGRGRGGPGHYGLRNELDRNAKTRPLNLHQTSQQFDESTAGPSSTGYTPSNDYTPSNGYTPSNDYTSEREEFRQEIARLNNIHVDTERAECDICYSSYQTSKMAMFTNGQTWCEKCLS